MVNFVLQRGQLTEATGPEAEGAAGALRGEYFAARSRTGGQQV